MPDIGAGARFALNRHGVFRPIFQGSAGTVAGYSGESMKIVGSGPSAGRGFRAAVVIVALVGAGGLLSACQKNIEGTVAAYADDQPAGVLYNRGLGYMNAGKFNDAIDEFNEVDRQHPYSEEARKALVMSAFASYRRGDYDNAIATAKRSLLGPFSRRCSSTLW